MQQLHQAHRNLGVPWVNTIAADSRGNALYTDVSVVPDIDAAQLVACAPGAHAAALRGPTGIVVLDGSKSECQWKRGPASPVPGLTPIERLPLAVRSDWVHNSNDNSRFRRASRRPSGKPSISMLKRVMAKSF